MVSRLVSPGPLQCLVLSRLCGPGEGAVCSPHLVCVSSWAYIFPQGLDAPMCSYVPVCRHESVSDILFTLKTTTKKCVFISLSFVGSSGQAVVSVHTRRGRVKRSQNGAERSL